MLIVNPDAAGIDVASTEYQVCVPEDRDADNNRRFDAFTCDLKTIAQWLKLCNIKTVAMEATGIYWVQLYIILDESGFDVVVCNAKHIKNLGEKKTDKVDASWIQLLHTYGLLPEIFQPGNKIREIKDMNRHRDRLINNCNQSLNRIQKALDMMNLKIHKVLSDIKGTSGLAILQAIAKGERDPEQLYKNVHQSVKATKKEILKSLEGNWVESQVFILKQNLDSYLYIRGQIIECDKRLEELLKVYLPLLTVSSAGNDNEIIRSKKPSDKNNAPHFDAEKYCFDILGVNITRIPGINSLSALKIVSELGPGFTEKFPTADKFCSWQNLVPNNKISGGKKLSSKLPKRFNYVGQVLRVCANTLQNHKGYLGDVFRVKKARSGHNQAIVSVAHKLARIIYKMVRDKVEYDEKIEKDKNQVYLLKKVEYYRKKLNNAEKLLLITSA